jgi:PhnB protein
MKNGVKPIPDGYHTVTPALIVRGATEAIEFYKNAFGAVELYRCLGHDGKTIAHAEIKIGDSVIFLGDECPDFGNKAPTTLGGSSSALCLYLEDVDAAYQKAVAAGIQTVSPPTDMFWGDRSARVVDPFGHVWSLATHVEDVTPEEIDRRGKEFFAQFAKKSA